MVKARSLLSNILTCLLKEHSSITKEQGSVSDTKSNTSLTLVCLVKYSNVGYGTVSYMEFLNEDHHGRKTDFKP